MYTRYDKDDITFQEEPPPNPFSPDDDGGGDGPRIVQRPDGKWYVVDDAGKPLSIGYNTQAIARGLAEDGTYKPYRPPVTNAGGILSDALKAPFEFASKVNTEAASRITAGMDDTELYNAYYGGVISRDAVVTRKGSEEAARIVLSKGATPAQITSINELKSQNPGGTFPPLPATTPEAVGPLEGVSQEQAQRFYHAEIVTYQDLVDKFGKGSADAILADPLTSSDQQAITVLREKVQSGEIVPHYREQATSTQATTSTATGAPSIASAGTTGYNADAVSTLYAAAQAAGFTGDALHQAVATALAESGGNFGAENRSALGVQENSMGAWQINLDAHSDKVPGATFEEKVAWLKDPYNAAKIAYQVSSGGTDWSPWSVWLDQYGRPAAGIYEQLAAANQALAAGDYAGAQQIYENINPAGGMAGSSTDGSTSGSTTGGPTVYTPPAPVADSRSDLESRGALPVSRNMVLGGQQYLPPETYVEQDPNGFWYIYNPDGSLAVQERFANPSQARDAQAYIQAGPAMVDPMGRSTLANQALTGQQPTIGSSPFGTRSIDEVIAASAEGKGAPGTHIGTLDAGFGLGSQDILLGREIPETGGLGSVQGASGDIYSFTGQNANGTSIGLGSPTQSNIHPLQRGVISNLPQQAVSEMNPATMLQYEQSMQHQRNLGLLPDLPSLAYSDKHLGTNLWEPAVQGIQNFADYNQMQFMPDPQNPVPQPEPVTNDPWAGNWWEGTKTKFYAGGGGMPLMGPTGFVDLRTGELKGVAGEAGPEHVEVTPLTRPKTGPQTKGGMTYYLGGGGFSAGYDPNTDPRSPIASLPQNQTPTSGLPTIDTGTRSVLQQQGVASARENIGDYQTRTGSRTPSYTASDGTIYDQYGVPMSYTPTLSNTSNPSDDRRAYELLYNPRFRDLSPARGNYASQLASAQSQRSDFYGGLGGFGDSLFGGDSLVEAAQKLGNETVETRRRALGGLGPRTQVDGLSPDAQIPGVIPTIETPFQRLQRREAERNLRESSKSGRLSSLYMARKLIGPSFVNGLPV